MAGTQLTAWPELVLLVLSWHSGDNHHISLPPTLPPLFRMPLGHAKAPQPARQAVLDGTRGPARCDARVVRRISLPQCAGCWSATAARAALPAAPVSVLQQPQPTSATPA